MMTEKQFLTEQDFHELEDRRPALVRHLNFLDAEREMKPPRAAIAVTAEEADVKHSIEIPSSVYGAALMFILAIFSLVGFICAITLWFLGLSWPVVIAGYFTPCFTGLLLWCLLTLKS